ncbi:MAG: SAM-dependent methyltransferase [Proteobacteria bacterium]|nr:SAM-dependent methyltransferase [Pseudomonadota bacterium]
MSSLPSPSPEAHTHSDRLCSLIHLEIGRHGGWIPFSRFMEMALYSPGMGYYSASTRKFGAAGDFVTAPEISSLFGRALARQLIQIMTHSTPHIIELGAGSGKLAVDILRELERQDNLPERYDILEVSADLRDRQRVLLQTHLPHLLDRVHWLDAMPDSISGVLIANEVLDALPVDLVLWTDAQPLERGVASAEKGFSWQERLPESSTLSEITRKINMPEGSLSEVSLAVRGLISSLSERLHQGVLLFIDYGFGASEYYHPQRIQGTLMCHYRHHAHGDPFFLPGLQDITSHVDFTAVAETAIDSGLSLYGYTTQAHFLINVGITDLLAEVDPKNSRDYLPLSAQLQTLTSPAEMGELFKFIAVGKGVDVHLCGFSSGDKSRTL